MTEAGIHEQRRYTSVLVHHPHITNYASLKRILGGEAGKSKVVRVGGTKWKVERFEYVLERNYYPERLTDLSSRRRPGGYAHDIYYATRSGINSDSLGPVVLLASPYVRLLERITRTIRKNVDGEAPKYVAVDMPSVYRQFSEGTESMIATKVTMQMLNQPGLELVSLAGRNPLHSELHAALKDVASPYSLRTEVRNEDQRCRVNIDRHGNLWWYQATEERIRMPLEFVDVLSGMAALKLTRSLPLDRVEEDDPK